MVDIQSMLRGYVIAGRLSREPDLNSGRILTLLPLSLKAYILGRLCIFEKR